MLLEWLDGWWNPQPLSQEIQLGMVKTTVIFQYKEEIHENKMSENKKFKFVCSWSGNSCPKFKLSHKSQEKPSQNGGYPSSLWLPTALARPPSYCGCSPMHNLHLLAYEVCQPLFKKYQVLSKTVHIWYFICLVFILGGEWWIQKRQKEVSHYSTHQNGL